ncbi:MAG: SpoIIE family protein phosphatase [Planctomycetota bacterium]
MVELVISCTDGRTQRRVLGDEPLVMGRDSACDVWIDDPAASRRHARFSQTAEGFSVEDLNSKNGTLVNGNPIDDAHGRQRFLFDGDVIEIGSTRVRFRAGTVDTGPEIVDDTNQQTTFATRYVSRDDKLVISENRLQIIYELSERLTRLQGRQELLDSAMEICVQNLNFEGGAIGLRSKDKKGVDWPVIHNLSGAEGGLRISRTLLNRALEHGDRAIFTEDGAGMSDPTQSIVQQGIRSAMCVPMTDGDEVLGVIYGDRTSTSKRYTNEDIDFFAGIAKQVSIGLINTALLDKQAEMARLNYEIDLARTIQEGLFPTDFPATDRLRVAAINEPGNRVSGDYYDVLPLENGMTWCIVADVTGEGVAASLLMAYLQAAVRLTIPRSTSPADLLSEWNKLLCNNTETSKFITCSLALIDPSSRKLWLSSAGHCLPVLVREGTDPVEIEPQPGCPLGVEANQEFPAQEVDLGDAPCTYVVYSDGVTEAMNNEQEMFGVNGLLECLRNTTDLNPLPVIKQIRREVTRFSDGAPQSDDITILAARIGS